MRNLKYTRLLICMSDQPPAPGPSPVSPPASPPPPSWRGGSARRCHLPPPRQRRPLQHPEAGRQEALPRGGKQPARPRGEQGSPEEPALLFGQPPPVRSDAAAGAGPGTQRPGAGLCYAGATVFLDVTMKEFHSFHGPVWTGVVEGF
ncbi:PREDICTED: proline-rich proteoglycan 2-like [Lepidothrix coronata]|uniref:Proline-rich proteoglycan 2-like n=1 Tax=Lepidothrix coronata TaxID=321398 RepID=A0A6J0H2B0_9PASS|nr:PREDICTED: proline-rich proteoglycan 2-like [Lepidothrix coronata]